MQTLKQSSMSLAQGSRVAGLPRLAADCRARRHVVARTAEVAVATNGAASNGNGAAAALAAPVAPLVTVPVAPASAPAPAPAPVISPEAFRDIVPPPKAYETVANLGGARVGMPWHKVLFMGGLAGVYIGLGGLLLLTVGANCPGLAASNPGLHKLVLGSFGLPVGLILVMTCGAELFTGNVALMTAAVIERKAQMKDLLSNWALSFAGNLAGAALLVSLVAASGLMAANPGPINAAVAKTSLTFAQAFSRGVVCNWMVCLAVWMASACNSFPAKFLAAWAAVSTFTAIGFEHSIANAFIIPMGIAVGAPVSISQFLTANLLPVTVGNIVGGAALALSYGYAFGRLGKPAPQKA